MRNPLTIAGIVAVALSLGAGCSTSKSGSPAAGSSDRPATTTTSERSPTTTTPNLPADTPTSIPTALAPAAKRPTPLAATVTCEYPVSTQAPAAKPATAPPGADIPAQGTVGVAMSTSVGDLALTLDRALAPCTVNSFVHLARLAYFDNTRCHRLTTSPALQVLQCGDPSGAGNGGPGYTFADEVYPELTYGRGYLAMANAGPNTNGSQFFIVYGDATLSPNYTVFGTLDDASMQKIDEVARAGAVPSNGPGDGAPKTPVAIQRVVVAG